MDAADEVRDGSWIPIAIGTELKYSETVFSPWMNILGSILGNYWRKRPVDDEPGDPVKKKKTGMKEIFSRNDATMKASSVAPLRDILYGEN